MRRGPEEKGAREAGKQKELSKNMVSAGAGFWSGSPWKCLTINHKRVFHPPGGKCLYWAKGKRSVSYDLLAAGRGGREAGKGSEGHDALPLQQGFSESTVRGIS